MVVLITAGLSAAGGESKGRDGGSENGKFRFIPKPSWPDPALHSVASNISSRFARQVEPAKPPHRTYTQAPQSVSAPQTGRRPESKIGLKALHSNASQLALHP